jgi:hypothetical protein
MLIYQVEVMRTLDQALLKFCEEIFKKNRKTKEIVKQTKAEVPICSTRSKSASGYQ